MFGVQRKQRITLAAKRFAPHPERGHTQSQGVGLRRIPQRDGLQGIHPHPHHTAHLLHPA